MKDTIKKINIIVLTLLLGSVGMLTACGGNSSSSEVKWPAMETLGGINAGDITSIELTRATEGGAQSETITDGTQMEDIFLRLKDITIKGESDQGTTDDDLGVKITAGSDTLGFSFEGDTLVLEDGSRYEVENLSSLKSYVDNLLGEKAAATEDSEGPAEAMHDASEYKDASGSSDYDVSKGFEKQEWQGQQILYFNDFMMTMPGNDKWGFDMDGNAVTFYLFSAQQEGYGGRLVTIKGYDIDDKSYEELPMPYHVAGVGKNVNKRFIAIYPSDVQYNFNDKTQSADYMELFEYLQKIGEGAENSPLQTSDSD